MLLCHLFGHKMEDKYDISEANEKVLDHFKTVVLTPRNDPNNESSKLTNGKYAYHINAAKDTMLKSL